uniref:Nerve growth factor a (beta polypeptide) n=1 Tax=Haplochromis burtoni TaxID=8153 RepID=A0A3Q2WI29_HAPBU
MKDTEKLFTFLCFALGLFSLLLPLSLPLSVSLSHPLIIYGEYSVCDSMNTWVSNLTKATDMYGNEVEVLPNVTINNVVKKQYFYETTCNSGCLGIDSRHWNSYCTNSHIFVSALTTFNEQTAWRYIRINAACVCVLSRKSWGGRRGH